MRLTLLFCLQLSVSGAVAADEPNKPQGETAPPVVRNVDGQVLTSTTMPAAKLNFAGEFKYVGGHSFILYDVAVAEQHFFVDANDKGRIKRMYWVQFEGYLPSNTHTYRYPANQTVKIGGLEFVVNTGFRNIKTASGRADSDGNRARLFLEGKAHPMASDDVMMVRLVHLVDKEKRNELMIIYMEDLSPLQHTAKDLAPGGPAAGQWDELQKGLLERAVKGLAIGP